MAGAFRVRKGYPGCRYGGYNRSAISQNTFST